MSREKKSKEEAARKTYYNKNSGQVSKLLNDHFDQKSEKWL